MDEILAFLEAKKRRDEYGPLQETIKVKNVQLKDGTTIGEVTIDQDTPEQERETINELLQRDPVVQSSEFPKTLLSEVINAYCNENTSLGNWTEKTVIEVKATLVFFTRIVGDEVFSTLKHQKVNEYKVKLFKLPPNINKVKRYRDKTIDEIIKMDDVKPMARNTLKKHLGRVSSLFEWAVKQGFTDKNYASSLTITKSKKAQDERSIFTHEDLKKLFESPEYKEQTYQHNYQYWIPLIALYSGARLTEICQLYLSDIKQIEGVYIFDINDRQDKKLKNSSSRRCIPIHSKLVELGLISYVNHLKLNKATRLFPEIKKGRDGYGQAASKWFGRYRKRVGIEESTKVFHSFRHTVIDQLKQQEVPKEMVANIAGHLDESVTFGRYGKAFKPQVMQQYIELLQYDFQHTKYHQV